MVPHIVAYGPSVGVWPVHGPRHEDGEIIGQPLLHFHVDPRFLSNEMLRRWCDNTVEQGGEGRQRLFGVVLTTDAEPIELPARCYRSMPPYLRVSLLPWFGELEEQHRGTRTDCRTCPHRRMPLAGLPRDRDGGVTCRGHGLRWDLASGELIPRARPGTGRSRGA